MPAYRKPPDQRQRTNTYNDLTIPQDEEQDASDDKPTRAVAKTRRNPSPPATLSDPAKKVWRAFWRSDVSKAIDESADLGRVERWIWYVHKWLELTQHLDNFGISTVGSKGQMALTPEARFLQFIESSLVRAESELGLTPKARAQLGISIAVLNKTVSDVLGDLANIDAQPLEPLFEDDSDDMPIDAQFKEVGDE